MRAQYEAAALPTSYYGQLANARLGLGEIALRPPPPEPASDTARELVHAADILYAIGERDLAMSFMADLARSNDVALVAALVRLRSAIMMSKRCCYRQNGARARHGDGAVRLPQHRCAAL